MNIVHITVNGHHTYPFLTLIGPYDSITSLRGISPFHPPSRSVVLTHAMMMYDHKLRVHA